MGTERAVNLHDEQARAWVVRLNGGRASKADRAAHGSWREAHPANEEAWRRAERTWALLGALGSSSAEVEGGAAPVRRRPAARRAAIAAGIAALVCVGTAWSYRPYPVEGLLADAATAAGEQRRFALADGSHVTLTGSSAIDIDFSGGRRGVTVLAGEALFEVAHDAGHPFTVGAGDARVTVTGTRFTVRRTGEGAAMMLAEGSVDARAAGGAAVIHARPGQRVDWHGGQMSAAPVAQRDIAAWRRGRLIFRSRPLSEVLETLSLYRSGRLYALGDAGKLRVTGVLDTADPDRFIDSLPESLPLRVTRVGPITLVRHRDAK